MLVSGFVTLLVSCSGGEPALPGHTVATPPNEDSSRAHTDFGASNKPDIGQLTVSMIADRQSFPVAEDASWNGPRIDPYSGGSRSAYEPQQCSILVTGPAAADGIGKANMRIGDRHLAVEISIATERPDFAAILDQCPTVTKGDQTAQLSRKMTEGLPSWSTELALNTTSGDHMHENLGIMGIYRGVYILVEASNDGTITTDNAAAAVKIFNDEVAILEAQ